MNQHLRILVAMIFALVATSKVSARTICGTVLSECDSTAVVGATCRLLADNKFISGTVSDISGAFTFDTDVSSNITLEIGMTRAYRSISIQVGYKSLVDGGRSVSETPSCRA